MPRSTKSGRKRKEKMRLWGVVAAILALVALVALGWGGMIDLERWLAVGGTLIASPLIHGAGKPGKFVLRPPNALPENRFLAACTRCGACIGSCDDRTDQRRLRDLRGAA